MDPTPTVLLAANPASRRGHSMAEAARQALQNMGYRVIDPDDGRPVERLIRDHAGICGTAAVVGGDGTLSAAAPALVETAMKLLIIPAGTANDLARTLAIPNDPQQAAGLMRNGMLQRIDLGEVNGVPFFNVASLGFGVALTRALTQEAKRRWGRLGYAVAAFSTMRRLRPFTVWITHGDRTHIVRTMHVAVGNGRHFGGGMTVAEDARIDDGRLDIFSLEVQGPLGLLKLLPAMRNGRHRHWTEVRTLEGETVEIRTRKPRRITTDGEITTRTPAQFRVLKQAVHVYVPGEPG